ncbi:hypothetical protein CS022_13740 [Veronia nyctiphanis]|uniref:Uncharacterized protein n=1 Tax=Veronia nyctiphanis TaxID=1278244 RepID=A0A4Q0YNY4_9GAMM|nr:hypothetical protein [Veronia nyctiphanis]RXJ72697.1 hypothetical protein CS022_13740 [Veronia nyctiphanis]
MKTTQLGRPEYHLLDAAIEEFCQQYCWAHDVQSIDIEQRSVLEIFPSSGHSAYRRIMTNTYNDFASVSTFLLSIGFASLKSTIGSQHVEFHYQYKVLQRTLLPSHHIAN